MFVTCNMSFLSKSLRWLKTVITLHGLYVGYFSDGLVIIVYPLIHDFIVTNKIRVSTAR